ncbi:Bug family tripartite tricarboxylate transporter substrate binding protein [Bordetella pertussis]|nr:tripartite tricarboxylate transporter substrate binding protein [Bordetella pertussis]AMS71416.1 hypothetical protein RD15_15955 [Bordetella pertussis]AMS74866.1 hypothetical protein RD16_04610 [Bordetella pertussis]ANT91390.1 hypothetical protein ADU61_04335 [Bordetella pertussis]AOY26042.1 hypothetical protein BH371_15165 [Bordetella pertussis]AQC95371.1 hypothetical protein AC888_04610 [Bordetella pertussis]
MMLQRLFAVLLAASTHAAACAQTPTPAYPERTVRFLVPYTPGGNADMLVRLLSLKLTEYWDKPVVVENKPGASGTIAVNTVAKAEPDGHTLVLGAAGNLVVANKLIKGLPYDPVEDLKAVSVVATPPFVLITAEQSRYQDVASLVADAGQRPEQITFGSAGIGSANHLSGELLALMKRVKFTHVAYKGMGPALNDVVAGRIDFAFAPIPLVLPQIQAGKLRALAVSGTTRTQVLPDVPTVSEAGVTGFESGAWFTVMVPKNTPDRIVDKINHDLKSAMQDADFIRKLAEEGAVPIGNTPAEASASLQSEMAKWGDLIDRLNLQPI